MDETRLILSRGGFPPYSARGCNQTLHPIETGPMKRTVNGELVYLSAPSHQKYRSVIRCEDQESPALDSLWPGEVIDVQCIQYLWQKIEEKTGTLNRIPRPDSLKVIDPHQEPCLFHLEGQQLRVETDTKGPWYIAYQPILTMRVVSYTLEHHEWQEKSPWVLTLEEL
jgi:hypothetical protein